MTTVKLMQPTARKLDPELFLDQGMVKAGLGRFTWNWSCSLQKSQNLKMNLHEFASPVKDIPPLRLVITVYFWISGVSTSTEGG